MTDGNGSIAGGRNTGANADAKGNDYWNLSDTEELRILFNQLGQSGSNYAWTPSDNPNLVEKVVNHFVTNIEPDWVDSVIRRDPALYKHFGLADGDAELQSFLEGKKSSDDLIKEGKLDAKTREAIEGEVMAYQGLHAIAFHRVAHDYYGKYEKKKAEAAERMNKGEDKSSETVQKLRNEAAKDLLIARKISQGVRRLTGGIEIHPGANIGKNWFVDHGAGIVIGETATVGDDCYFYHNVTLGATSRKRKTVTNEAGARHPQVGSHVTLSNGVQILGPTIVHDDVKVAPLAELNGCREIGEGSKILDGAKLVGDITLGKKVRIGAGALVVGDVTIGDGAVIDPGVKVTQNIPANAHVVGEVPNLPGALSPEEIGTPIMVQITPKAANDAQADPKNQPIPVVYAEGLELTGKAYRKAANGSWRDRVNIVEPQAVNAAR